MKLLKCLPAATLLLILAGCGDDIDLVFDPFNAADALSIPGAPANVSLIGLDASGTKLVRFNSASPGILTATLNVAGLQPGQTLVGIDFRPQNAGLYGLGYNPASGTVQLYSINAGNGVATPVGSTGTFTLSDGVTTVPVQGSGFGFDFDPATDRVRVVNTAGQNFRIDPNSGAFVDGDPDSPGVQMDAAPGSLDAAAYAGATLYTLDSSADRLRREGSSVPLVVNGAPLDFTTQNGFDVGPNGVAFAALEQANGEASSLFSINLGTGAALQLGSVGYPLRGLTVQL